MRCGFTVFLVIITIHNIDCVRRHSKRLALWIDDKQVEKFIGYKLDVFIISDGNVVSYIRNPTFEKSVPVIPPEVNTVNLTWEAPADTYTYWFDDLKSLDEELLYQPLLSIPVSGIIPEGPKVFQMSIPCTGKNKGIAALILGLQIFVEKSGLAIRGSPLKLKLKKQCEAFVPSTLCESECLNGGRCNSLGHCECMQGFAGLRCERSMCDPGCENNGTCMSPKVCICPDGYSGERCERALCKSACQHGGRCIQEDVCWCTSGFYGKSCQFSRCKPECQHGGVCVEKNKCSCPVGFKGKTCQKRKRPKRRSSKNRRKKKKGKNKKRRRNKKVKRKNRKSLKKKGKMSLLEEVRRFSNRKRRKELKRQRRRQRRRRRRKEKRKPGKKKRIYVR